MAPAPGGPAAGRERPLPLSRGARQGAGGLLPPGRQLSRSLKWGNVLGVCGVMQRALRVCGL